MFLTAAAQALTSFYLTIHAGIGYSIFVVATPALDRKPSICAEKQRLSGAFLLATRDLQKLHNTEISELLHGVTRRPGRGRYDLAINLARKRLDGAKRAYMLHVQEHGC